MDFSSNWILASFFVSTVGAGIFMYGKKQSRVPQIVAGLLIFAISCVVSSPAWMFACTALVIGGLWVGTRAGL